MPPLDSETLPDPDVPCGRIGPEDLILRNLLSINRTVLANGWTLLSCFRTVLAMFAAGASLIHFIAAAYAWFARGGNRVVGWSVVSYQL